MVRKKVQLAGFGIVVVLFAVLAVVALPLLTPQTFVVNDSITVLFNITVNNSEVGSVNISWLNITLPAGFSYLVSTAGTSTPNTTFSNLSQTLAWNINETTLTNLTNQTFWFNATANATTVGSFNFSVALVNNTSTSDYNITVNVGDASIPYKVSFVAPTPVSLTYSNTTSTSITLNVSAMDHINVSSVNITIYNITRNLINSTFLNSSSLYNYTFIISSEGNYSFNATAIDTSGNKNYTETRNLIIDRTAPNISAITETSNTTTRITVSFSCSDDRSGVKNCSIGGASDGSISGSSITGLDCGIDDYTVTVFAQDYANNTRTVTSGDLGTDACSTSSDSTSSSGSESADSNVTWTATYTVQDNDFKAGYSKELAVKNRIKFNVNSAQHTLGVISLTGTRATINVSSTPQQATLGKGDSKKFDVDDDNFYDILVTLNSINNSKANITVLAIAEEMAAKKITSTSTAGNATSAAKKTANSTTTNSTANSIRGKSLFSNFSSSYYKIGIIGIAIGLLIVLYIIGREKRWFDRLPLFYKHAPST